MSDYIRPLDWATKTIFELAKHARKCATYEEFTREQYIGDRRFPALSEKQWKVFRSYDWDWWSTRRVLQKIGIWDKIVRPRTRGPLKGAARVLRHEGKIGCSVRELSPVFFKYLYDISPEELKDPESLNRTEYWRDGGDNSLRSIEIVAAIKAKNSSSNK
ncbi:MAG: hypothetical protein ORN83_07220 [Chthoniobacteraceae bacterium]|jgi:hypothetical protein|nr:hypothetical protein [Chthoniobacteraceae bacterium]